MSFLKQMAAKRGVECGATNEFWDRREGRGHGRDEVRGGRGSVTDRTPADCDTQIILSPFMQDSTLSHAQAGLAEVQAS